MLRTQADIARMKGVGRHAVNVFVEKHGIEPAGKKGKLKTYDIAAEPLASYISGKVKKLMTAPKSPPTGKNPKPAPAASPPPTEKKKSAGKKIGKEKPPADKMIKKYEMPLNQILSAKIGNSGELSAAFYQEALEMARESKDATLIFKLAAAADKEAKDSILREQMQQTEIAREKIAIEKANALRIRNELETGIYIKRETVKKLFGRVYAVHTSALQPLGLKLASILAAIPAGENREVTMQKFIDNEIFSALESIQRILLDNIENGSA
jgi:hypothetical protein